MCPPPYAPCLRHHYRCFLVARIVIFKQVMLQSQACSQMKDFFLAAQSASDFWWESLLFTFFFSFFSFFLSYFLSFLSVPTGIFKKGKYFQLSVFYEDY